MTALPFKRALAIAALILTSALWGSNGTVSRALLEVVPPVTMGVLRWVVVFLLLIPIVWPERRAIAHALRHDWKVLLPLGFLGGATQSALVYSGLAGSTAIHLGLLNSVIPVLIILISWAWHGRRPRALESAGLVLSLTGVLLILAHGELQALLHLQFNPGDLLMLCGMLTWAVYTIKLGERPQALSLFGFVFTLAVVGGVLVLPALVVELWHTGLPQLGVREFTGLLYIGALPSLAAAVMFSYGVERIGAVQAGIFIHFMPVFAVIFAALFIGEQLYAYHVAGFVLVAGGAIVSCFRQEPVLSSAPRVKM